MSSSKANQLRWRSWKSPAVLAPIGAISLAGLLYVYSTVAIDSAKSNAKRLREQDGGTLDLHRQSLRQHGLLHDRDSVQGTVVEGATTGATGKGDTGRMEHEEAIRAEARRRKAEARMREVEEMKKVEKERNSLWNWIRGK